MKCFFCTAETEYFCICRSKSSIVCERHISSHTNENSQVHHSLEKIDHYPSSEEKIRLAKTLKEKISILEIIKANKIKEKYQEFGKILSELKKVSEIIDEDILKLSCLLSAIFSSNKFSRIENSAIVLLFNSSYEEAIKILEDNGWLNFKSFVPKISSTYQWKEAQETSLGKKSLDSKSLSYSEDIVKIPEFQDNQTSREMPNSNAVWSKLTEDGNFVPYGKADNDIIESAYQKKYPFAIIVGSNSQCYVNLISPMLEIQEEKKVATSVIRNNSIEIFDSKDKFVSWYFKGDKGWEEMNVAASRMAEWVYQNKYNEVLIQGENKKPYILDVKNMKQVNPKTNYKRKIRRGNAPDKAEEIKKGIRITAPLPIRNSSTMAEELNLSISSSSSSDSDI